MAASGTASSRAAAASTAGLRVLLVLLLFGGGAGAMSDKERRELRSVLSYLAGLFSFLTERWS